MQDRRGRGNSDHAMKTTAGPGLSEDQGGITEGLACFCVCWGLIGMRAHCSAVEIDTSTLSYTHKL